MGLCRCSYILLSLVLPNNGNLSVLHSVQGRHGPMNIVVMSTGSSLNSGIGKLRVNTSSCLTGPFRLPRLDVHVCTVVHHGRFTTGGVLRDGKMQVSLLGGSTMIGRAPVRLAGSRCRLLLFFVKGGSHIVSGDTVTRRLDNRVTSVVSGRSFICARVGGLGTGLTTTKYGSYVGGICKAKCG